MRNRVAKKTVEAAQKMPNFEFSFLRIFWKDCFAKKFAYQIFTRQKSFDNNE
jgi:hypothetical protein